MYILEKFVPIEWSGSEMPEAMEKKNHLHEKEAKLSTPEASVNGFWMGLVTPEVWNLIVDVP